jgi:preprotein translocase subunit SecA
MALGLKRLIKGLIGDSNTREIARLQNVVEEINALEPEFASLSPEELGATTEAFRRRLAHGETLDDVLPEAFAAVREACRRTIGLRHYDVQLIGGMILHQREIAEMKTGEGKTLVATLPLFLNGLELNPDWIDQAEARWGSDPDHWDFVPLDGLAVGRGVHLVTVNEYLARRDGGWMGPAFHLLGMSVGLVISHFSALYDPGYVEGDALLDDDRLVHWRPSGRSEAYRADVTYGTNNEFGFDYLRDNMARDLRDCVQRKLNYAIVDEIDNVLIDEARTPLIISGPAEEPSELYARFARLVRRLKRDVDYEVDERTKVVTLTDEGINKVESQLPDIPSGESLYDAEHAHMLPYLSNALHADVIYKRDKDYIVKDGQVVIVDEHTGRMLHGRRYSEGLHQAIEAKEGLAIQRESLTYGTITVQNYFRMYRKLAGMTGTAATEREEFRTIYDLDVLVLPTNVAYRAEYGDLEEQKRQVDEVSVTFAGVLEDPERTTVTTYEREIPTAQQYFQRLDLEDSIYPDQGSKFESIVEEIEALHQAERPVLVGTIAVETSEYLSRLLKLRGIPHNVLNAKHHEQEAVVIAQAGRPGAVTVATNMAGRGVDIVLGGEPAALAARALQKRLESRLTDTIGRLIDPRQESDGDLSEDAQQTAEALLEEYAAYEEARSQGGSALPVFYTDQLIEQNVIHPDHRADGVRLTRHVLTESWEEAGRMAQRQAGVSQETVSRLQRMREQFEQARDARHYAVTGLAGTYHNLLMGLIRLTLGEETEAARELLTEYPELPTEVLGTIAEVRETCQRDQQKVLSLGGLHVIGTERHDARRIDNQLRGRAGRQGDPGSSRFFLSLEDELMRRFGGERTQQLMQQWGMGDMPLEFGILSRTVESAQKRVEGYNFDIRKHILEYDDVVNTQREVIYDQRQQVLSEPDLRDQVLRMVQEEVSGLVAEHCAGYAEDWDLDGLVTALRAFFPLPEETSPQAWKGLSRQEIEEQLEELAEFSYDAFYHALGLHLYTEAERQEETLAQMEDSADSLRRLIYQRVVKRLGSAPDPAVVEQPLGRLPDPIQAQVKEAFVEGASLHRDRQIMLQAVDGLWVRHLTDLAILREGIGLRAFGQQDPLVAFQKEAHEMYQQLLGHISSRVARRLFLMPKGMTRPTQPRRLRAGRPSPVRRQRRADTKPTPRRKSEGDLGRNDPCWCGSGKKYKYCHMREDMRAERSSRTDSRGSRRSRRGRQRC